MRPTSTPALAIGVLSLFGAAAASGCGYLDEDLGKTHREWRMSFGENTAAIGSVRGGSASIGAVGCGGVLHPPRRRVRYHRRSVVEGIARLEPLRVRAETRPTRLALLGGIVSWWSVDDPEDADSEHEREEEEEEEQKRN